MRISIEVELSVQQVAKLAEALQLSEPLSNIDRLVHAECLLRVIVKKTIEEITQDEPRAIDTRIEMAN